MASGRSAQAASFRRFVSVKETFARCIALYDAKHFSKEDPHCTTFTYSELVGDGSSL